MGYKIIWSPDALDDIEAIGEYIARDSEFYAESTVFKIYEAPQSLISFGSNSPKLASRFSVKRSLILRSLLRGGSFNLPKLGRVVPEIGDETIRELFVFQYRIIYEIKSNEIHILTVIHGKRLLDKDKI